MGFSLVAAAAIIGVGILMAIEIIVGITIPSITDIHDAYGEMRDRAIEQVQTDINITSAIAVTNGTNHHDLTFIVNNTGSITLEISNFNIIVNGTKETFTCTTTYLYPEQEATFTVEYLYGRSVNIRLKVIANNGIEDYFTYTVS